MARKRFPEKLIAPLREAASRIPEQIVAATQGLNSRTMAELRDQLDALNAVELRFEPGEMVFEEGEAADVMYLIMKGCAAVFKGTLDAPTVLAYRNRPGDFMGDMALLEGNRRSASVVAVKPLLLLKITPDAFWKLLAMDPITARDLLGVLSSRLRESDDERRTGSEKNRLLQNEVSVLSTERDRLLELEQVREETTHLIVHDLRNPLWMIQGALDNLKSSMSEPTDPMSREMLDIAIAAHGRMKNLIDVLLETARLEDGKERFHMQPTDANRLLDQVAERFGLFLRYQNIQLHMQRADVLPRVQADPIKVERVLVNLLDNAIKHTPGRGGITLASDLDGNWIRLSVIDTGPGIPESARRRIFERYNQVGKDKLGKGYGLGLRFCKLAVEGHGGDIKVEPGPGGVGSCFSFTLPVGEAEMR